MLSFQDVAGRLGYDSLAPMYQALGGQGNPFLFDPGEGGPQYLDVKGAQAVNNFDPSFFDGYQFKWIPSGGYGNSGTVEAYKDGKGVGGWSQKDQSVVQSLLEAGALAAAAFGGIGMLGHGPMAGLFGGSGASGVGLDAAGNLAGSSLMDGAVSQAMTAAGSLAPEGVAALIPTGAQLGAAGGGSLLAGGLLGGGVGSAPAAGAVAANVAGNAPAGSTLDGLKKAGGKVADWAVSNPKGAGALLGGLLGGAGGGSGGSGGAYTGPMPTITRGDWNANPQAQMMQVPQFGVTMPTTGQRSSGLLRFGG